jgi:hypothetical protein
VKYLMALGLAIWLLFSSGAIAFADTITSAELQEIEQLWQSSPHAITEVNCSSCHRDAKTQQFVAQPTQESCQSCHEFAVETFGFGKHGIRLHEGLSPLTPAMAKSPMKAAARSQEMNCNACHNVHSVNTVQASVESCLTCHNDTHSLNYENSQHAQLFANQKELVRPNAESVTCATCHLPRQHQGETVLVNHNNTYTLLPRDRMVQEVCLNCHGVEYSYNSIFDNNLVEANFDKPPNLKLKTFELVRDLEKRRVGE